MRNLFNSIRVQRPGRNIFDLSHQVKMTMNMGKLVPFICDEVVPGDKFRVSSDVMIRFAPMLAPVMHHVNVYCHYFFVPNRLLWNQWEDFITGGPDGTANPIYPMLSVPGAKTSQYFAPGSLANYLGLPAVKRNSVDKNPYVCSVLPFRAYQLIYNEYYRDQNIEEPVVISKGAPLSDDESIDNLCALRTRAWEKDYFTSALPWPQRGSEVSIPLEGSAPVVNTSTSGNPRVQMYEGGRWQDGRNGQLSNNGGSLTLPNSTGTGYVNARLYYSNNQLQTDLTQASGVSVNDLRRSFALQRWLERNARGGARYIEQILSHFGVRSSDARLQRPEYLGGGRQPVSFSAVIQTSATAPDSTQTPLAEMAGYGISVGSINRFQRFFEEHGWIIGIISVTPRSSYSQGMPRQFFKTNKLDYYFPAFAHLGEQEILNKELYYSPDDGDKMTDVFGYTPRYAEYKFKNSRSAGDFVDSLNFWTLDRMFTQLPGLNDKFIHIQDDETNRIFAVQDADVQKLYVQVFNNMKASRLMPKYGTPMM